ncbi:MAG: PEGA domain-containing protein [Candidatus Eiseniibacteriota bacterium]
MAAHRSDFLHAWVVGNEFLPESAIDSLIDLERQSLEPTSGPASPSGAVIPTALQQLLTGLAFVRSALWGPWCAGRPPLLFGLVSHEDRVWAVAAGCDAQLEQLTGSPLPFLWHEWGRGSGLNWMELDAAEAWRIGLSDPALAVHYRPSFGTVEGGGASPAANATTVEPEDTDGDTGADTGAEDDMSLAVLSSEDPTLDAPLEDGDLVDDDLVDDTAQSPAPAIHRERQGESRSARRRRRKRERARERAQERGLSLVEPVEASVAVPVADETLALPEKIKADADSAATGLLETPEPARAPRRPKPAPAAARVASPAPRARRPLALPLPRWSAASFRWPAFLRGRVGLAIGAALVIATVGAFVIAREPIARAVVGRYTLAITTSPAGATVRVDGELVPGKTPLDVPLEPGAHRIELAYGEYANSLFSVEGKRDQKIERSVEWVGSLGLASSDTSAAVSVAFDGRPWGALPLWKDDVPVGRHRLSFSGAGVRPWEEEVQIKSGQSTRVTAEPVRVPPYGLVTARAERVTSEGVEDVDGAAVFVDGAQAGVTPTDLKLDPGPHSVRIRSGDGPSPVHLIEVQAGGRYFASTQFGRPAEPWVAFDPPARLSLAKPHMLTVALAAEVPLPVREMWLWWRKDGGEFERLALLIIQIEGRTRGTITLPTAGLKAGGGASYYVAIKTREGEEYFSEVRSLPVVP